jgi:hypothetical protein
MNSLILQAAEQLEKKSSSFSSAQIMSHIPSTEIIYPSGELDEQTQRMYDVAEIMAKIGYGNHQSKDVSVKRDPHSHQSISSLSSAPASPSTIAAASSASASSSSISSMSTAAMTNPNNFIMLTKRKKEVYMTRQDWEDACTLAIECMKLNTKTEITISHFALELETRCTVKNNGIRLFMMFPWFHMKNIRFRQSLKRDGRLGPTIEKVIDCVNYFLKKNGKDYSEEEIQFLYDYYRRMEVPEPSRCLTTIVEVYSEFRKFQDEIYSRPPSLPACALPSSSSRPRSLPAILLPVPASVSALPSSSLVPSGTNSQSEVIKILLEQSRMIEDLGQQMKSLRREVESLRDSVESPARKRARIEREIQEQQQDEEEQEQE